MGSFFRIRNFGCQIRNQRPKRHTNGWCSHCIAENCARNPAYRSDSARHKLTNLWNTRSCFASINMPKRSSTGVNLQPIYEPISTYLSKFCFVIPGSRNQFGQKMTFCGRKLFDPASTKMFKLIFKSYIFDHWVPWQRKCPGSGDKN